MLVAMCAERAANNVGTNIRKPTVEYTAEVSGVAPAHLIKDMTFHRKMTLTSIMNIARSRRFFFPYLLVALECLHPC